MIPNHVNFAISFYYRLLGPRIILGFALVFVASVIESVGLTLIFPIIPRLFSDFTYSSLGEYTEGAWQFIQDLSSVLLVQKEIIFLLLVALIVLGKSLVLIASLFLVSALKADLNFNIKKLVYRSIADIGFARFSKLTSGTVMSSMIPQCERALQGFNALTVFISNAINILVYGSVALFVSVEFGVLALLVGSAFVLLLRPLTLRVRLQSGLLVSALESVSQITIDFFEGFKVLKANGQKNLFGNKFHSVVASHSSSINKLGQYSAIIVSAREPILMLCVVLLLVYERFADLNLWENGSIVAVFFLFYRVANAILACQKSAQYVAEFSASITELDKFFKTLNEDREMISSSQTQAIGKLNSIKFESVELPFGASGLINFEATCGKMIGFLGPSGVGKTTLLDIIAGLHFPASGRVLLNGADLSGFNIEEVRKRLVYFSGEALIIADTLRENITLSGSYSSEQLVAACEAANIDWVDRQFKFDSEESFINSSSLSAGQRQRVGLARAFMKDADLYLFDEPTSAQDSKSQSIIMEAIRKLSESSIVLVISHRPESLTACDVVYQVSKAGLVRN